MNNKMTHQNTLLTQTQMCPKGFDDEHIKHQIMDMLLVMVTVEN